MWFGVLGSGVVVLFVERGGGGVAVHYLVRMKYRSFQFLTPCPCFFMYPSRMLSLFTFHLEFGFVLILFLFCFLRFLCFRFC